MSTAAAVLEKLARDTAPQFVAALLSWLGAIRDGIRAAQYDVGMPYVYMQSIILAPASNLQMAVNVENYGTIDNWQWCTINQTAGPADAVCLAGVVRVSVAAQNMYNSLDGTFPQVRNAAGAAALVGGPLPNGGSTLPSAAQGNLRRIPVAQGDVIQVDVRNTSATDTYQVSFMVSQYRTTPPHNYPQR